MRSAFASKEVCVALALACGAVGCATEPASTDLDAEVGDVVAVDVSLDAIVGSLVGALTYDRVPVAQDANFG